jgi:tRNA(Ile)-lysidine synthase
LRWALECGLDVTAAHYNHGLRAQADDDEDYCRHFCLSLGVPFVSEKGVVARRGKGLEDEARRRRYDFLQRAAKERLILTAHTADDNAETILLNLIRGTGPQGLGIPRHRGNIFRPLLRVTRHEVLEYLREHGLEHLDDLSNGDPAFARNRLRRDALPCLRELNPRAVANIARAASLIQEDDALLTALAESEPMTPENLLRLPKPIASRVVRRECARYGLAPTQAHTDAVLALCASPNPHASANLPGGIKAARRYNGIELTGKERETPEYTLRAEPAEAAGRREPNVFYVSRESVKGRLSVRPRKPGDSFAPHGRNGTKSLKKLFIDDKIPKCERAFVPVVEDETGIVAVGGFGIAGRCAVVSGLPVLRITVEGWGGWVKT